MSIGIEIYYDSLGNHATSDFEFPSLHMTKKSGLPLPGKL